MIFTIISLMITSLFVFSSTHEVSKKYLGLLLYFMLVELCLQLTTNYMTHCHPHSSQAPKFGHV